MSSHTASTVLEPRLVAQSSTYVSNGLEVSLHTLPKQLLREFRHVFRDEYLNVAQDGGAGASASAVGSDVAMTDGEGSSVNGGNNGSNNNLVLLALPTNQRAREDLVAIGDHIEAEKDRLLNVFMDFGTDISQKIRAQGYWADYIDPCSGLPMLTLNCNKVYSEVDGMECLLNYRAYNAGFCKILTHPRWGSAVYPATIFAYCPIDVARAILMAYPDAALDIDVEKANVKMEE